MTKHKDLDRISPSITPEEFYNNYVSKRIPVVLKGLPDDADFKARAWVRPTKPLCSGSRGVM